MYKLLENKRLQACAQLMRECPSDNRIAADIGTDHGYLPVYLVQSGICAFAVAADINPRPLASAKKNIAAQGLEKKIDTVLSDGLKNVPRRSVTDIICAGMGGELIAEILSQCSWAKECTLILQPMSKPERLREWLYDNGFAVKHEIAVRDKKFVYSVMRAEFTGGEFGYRKTDRYLAAGLIRQDEMDGAEYIRTAAKRMRRAAEGMLSADSSSEKAKKLLKLSEELLYEIGEGS